MSRQSPLFAAKGAARPAAALELSTAELTAICARALQAATANANDPIGRIAIAIRANRRTAKNHYYAVNAPDALHLLRYMAAIPGFAEEMHRLTGAARAEIWDAEHEAARQRLLAAHLNGGR